MLKINASYSKKIPVAGEQFSSQSFHASIECECADALTAEQLQAKIHDTFTLVRDAVEAELHGKSAEKPEPAAQTSKPEPTAQTSKPEPTKPDTAKASNRQIKFITDLATAQRVGLSELNAGIQKRFGVGGLYDLSRREASLLLDSMKGQKKAA